MKNGLFIAFATAVLLGGLFFLFTATQKNKSALVATEQMGGLEDFSALDHQGNFFELYREARSTGAKAIVFFSTGVGCPIVQKSLQKVEFLAKKYGPEKILFVLVNSNQQDDRASIVANAAEFSITLPILMDQNQMIAESLAMDRTAEAVVVETVGWQILYRGAIDDRFNYSDGKLLAKNEYLADALDDIIADRSVRQAKTRALGCAITKIPSPKPITYHADIAPIIEAKCVICHHAGGAQPNNLSTYGAAKGWSAMIRELVRKRLMPPPQADSFYGDFLGNTALSAAEARLLMKWPEGSALEGKPSEAVKRNVSPERKFRNDYAFGPVTLHFPAQATDPVGNVFLGRASKDLWITANQIETKTTTYIHHQKLMAFPNAQALAPSQAMFMENKEGQNVSIIYLRPRQPEPEFYPRGLAKKIPAGSFIYLEQHLSATGKPEKTEFSIRMQLGNPKELSEIKRLFLVNTEKIEIPPGDSNFKLKYSIKLESDIELLSFSPHMHKRGKKISLLAETPDGKSTTLMSVPRYAYSMNRSYWLKKPVRLKAGTVLSAIGIYDNSSSNPNHIDSSATVTSGSDMDKHEMLFLMVEYILPKVTGLSGRELSPSTLRH